MQLIYNDSDDAFEISVPQKMAVLIGLVLESLVGIGMLLRILLLLGWKIRSNCTKFFYCRSKHFPHSRLNVRNHKLEWDYQTHCKQQKWWHSLWWGLKLLLWISYQVAIGSAHKTIFLALNALKAHVYFIETCQYHLSYVITVGCYYASAATAVFIAISGSLPNHQPITKWTFLQFKFQAW